MHNKDNLALKFTIIWIEIELSQHSKIKQVWILRLNLEEIIEWQS